MANQVIPTAVIMMVLDYFNLLEDNKIDINEEDSTFSSKQQESIIESIVCGYHIVYISLCKNKDELKYTVVDGTQRLLALNAFYTNQIRVTVDDEQISYRKLVSNSTVNDKYRELLDKILNYTLSVCVFVDADNNFMRQQLQLARERM